MREIDQLSALVADIYDAGLDPALWNDVLHQAANFIGGISAAIHGKDASARSGNVYYDDHGLDRRYVELYFDKYVKLDPSRRAGDARRIQATAQEMAEVRSIKASLAGIIYVYDGDTVIIHHQHIRLLGFDAPEVKHPRCRAEVNDGINSRDRLRQILSHAHAISIRPSGDVDRYHRLLIHLFADKVDVGTTLMAENLAVAWKPGRTDWRQRRRHWCGF